MAIWNNTFSRLSLALNKVVCDWLISDTQPERTQGERPRQERRYTPLLEVNQANISLVVLDNELPEPNSIFIFAIIFEEWPRWQETGLTRETCRSESVWTNSCRSLSWFMVHSRPLWVRSWRNKLSLNECPPYTEIFSKRRKIYSVCVESLSLTIDNCSTSLFCFEMNLDVASYNRVHLLTSATLDLKTTTKSII